MHKICHTLNVHTTYSNHPLLLTATSQEFGLEHPAVALSLATLSTIQRARQQLAPALESVRRCAAIRAKGKGPAAEGPQMASALQQEALVRMDLGQLEEAAGLAARALEMRQRALVKEHPDVALSLMGGWRWVCC